MPVWEESGHFAMTEKGLQFVAETLMGAKDSKTIARVTDLGADYSSAQSNAGPSGAVLASVTETDFYEQSGAIIEDPAKGGGGPSFVHWVILEDVEKKESSTLSLSDQPKSPGKFYALKIWTWAKHFVAKIMENVASSYIYNLVTGKFREKAK